MDSLSGRTPQTRHLRFDVATMALPVRTHAEILMPDLSGHTVGIIVLAVFIAVLGWSVYQMDKTFHE
jgi:hypothetical protein